MTLDVSVVAQLLSFYPIALLEKVILTGVILVNKTVPFHAQKCSLKIFDKRETI